MSVSIFMCQVPNTGDVAEQFRLVNHIVVDSCSESRANDLA